MRSFYPLFMCPMDLSALFVFSVLCGMCIDAMEVIKHIKTLKNNLGIEFLTLVY